MLHTSQSARDLLDRVDLAENLRFVQRPTVRSHRIVYIHGGDVRTEAKYYPTRAANRFVLFCGGVGTAQKSPALNLYARLGEEFQHRRTATVCVKFHDLATPSSYRQDLEHALAFIRTEGAEKVLVVAYGDSADAAVQFALAHDDVAGLAFLAPAGLRQGLEGLSPRCPIFMLQGERDPNTADGLQAYETAKDPKARIVLPKTTASLDENSTETLLRLREKLFSW